MTEPLVISIGGSVLAPDGPDERFLRRFRPFVQRLARTRMVVLVCGGGSISRTYIASAKHLGVRSVTSQHWIGIRATTLNAELLRAVLGVSHPVVHDYSTIRRRSTGIIVAAGNTPGHTTDYCAVRIAHTLDAHTVVNVTNVPGVFTADPRRVPSARRIPLLTWREYRAMITRTATPGMHVPFDPVASALADRSRCSVFVVSRDLQNLAAVVRGRRFTGTRIGPLD